jgi:hypothetical protein
MQVVQAVASQQFVNGVAVSSSGRIFCSAPRWAGPDTPSVLEASHEGWLRPFPGDEWNEWRPGLPSENRIVSTHSVYADKIGNDLWVIDDASPRGMPPVAGAAKLVRIDLDTDTVSGVYRFGLDVLPPGSVLGHMRVDGRFAYVTEAHHAGSIVVVDLASGAVRKALEGHPMMLADPSIVPVIEGREFRLANGAPPKVHVDLLELSPDRRWLYFMALFGPMLRRIETKYLTDPSLSDAEIATHVEDVAAVPPCAGVIGDPAGNLYLCSFTQDAILKLAPDGRLETLVTDPRISFPNEGSVGPDNCLYFPGSQIHRLSRGGATLPFEVLKIDLGGGD